MFVCETVCLCVCVCIRRECHRYSKDIKNRKWKDECMGRKRIGLVNFGTIGVDCQNVSQGVLCVCVSNLSCFWITLLRLKSNNVCKIRTLENQSVS